MRLLTEAAAGAVGGLALGAVMTAVMTAGKATGKIEEPLPLKVERWAARRVGVLERPPPEREMAVAQGGHLAYSAALGAGYGLLRGLTGLPAIPSGPLFGLALYGANLLALGPALGLTRGPWDEPKTTAARRLMMHVLYGTGTALVAEQVRRRIAG